MQAKKRTVALRIFMVRLRCGCISVTMKEDTDLEDLSIEFRAWLGDHQRRQDAIFAAWGRFTKQWIAAGLMWALGLNICSSPWWLALVVPLLIVFWVMNVWFLRLNGDMEREHQNRLDEIEARKLRRMFQQ